MRPVAGLNADKRRLDARKQLQHFRPPQAPSQNRLPSLIYSVHLKDALRDIKSDHLDSKVPSRFVLEFDVAQSPAA